MSARGRAAAGRFLRHLYHKSELQGVRLEKTSQPGWKFGSKGQERAMDPFEWRAGFMPPPSEINSPHLMPDRLTTQGKDLSVFTQERRLFAGMSPWEAPKWQRLESTAPVMMTGSMSYEDPREALTQGLLKISPKCAGLRISV